MTPQGEPPREEPTSWAKANAAASPELGGGGRRRLAKRALDRLARPHLARQGAFNEAVLGALVEVRDDLARQVEELRRAGMVVEVSGTRVALDDELTRLRRALDTAAAAVQLHGDVIGALRDVVDGQLLDREAVSQEIDLARQQAFARFHDGVGALRKELGELSRELAVRADSVDRRLARAERALEAVRLSLAGAGPVSRPPSADRAAADADEASRAACPGDRFAALYASFEDELRGPEGLIKERMAGYLADLEPLRGKGTVLDVGCGRGDLLVVLQEAGIGAYGVESSTGYADHWKMNGLDVRVADAIEHLRQVPPASLAAVTAIQVVEHLATDGLLGLLEASFEALAPGGLLVLETPNPENLTVGAFTFYLDPTHDRPIPAALLAFLVRSQGFEDVEVRYLRRPELHGLPPVPADVPWAPDVAAVRDVVDHYVYGAQDYAVLARRG